MKIGKNYHSYYNGNVGYYIEEKYRGHGFAFMATKMLYPLSLAHKQNKLILTCDEDNLPSCKTIKKLGGILLETIEPPEDYFAYYEGMPKQHIFILSLE